jgi:hypothetical protein
MHRSLKAFVALSIFSAVVGGCASTGVEDELAGETAEDAALDGKADGAIDGSYTYFEIWRDMRKCISPLCGGFYLHRLNRTSTICHNGSPKWACYTPELDWTEANLSDELKGALFAAAEEGAMTPGAVALVRGRFAPKTFTGYGNMGRFVVTEAWVAEGDGVSEGVFARVKDNGIRCIQSPCPTVTEKGLNKSTWANIHGLDFSYGGFAEDQISKMWQEMVDRPSGVIIAGDRYTWKENGITAKGRTVTAAYRRLESVAAPGPCFKGGCSGQLCSDQEGAISTCEWREEYACYQTATCERQGDGSCGWTETAELTTCLGSN